MNICFLSGDITRSGGTERATIEISNQLINKYNIHILSFANINSNPFFTIDPRIQLSKINETYNKNKYINYLKKILSLRKYINQHDIDLLISVDTELCIYSVPALFLSKTKLIAWEHFAFYHDSGMRIRKVGRFLASKFADAIVVLTNKDKNNFSKHYNLRCPIFRIYNIIPDKEDYKKEAYDIKSKLIISAGNLTYQKGFDMAIEIGKKVFLKHPTWKWYIFGEGEDQRKLQKLISEEKLDRNIIIKEKVNNLGFYYEKASMFILTSRFEGFGLVLTEAKSYYLPCISFDIDSGPAEIIDHGVNGFLIEPFNINKMADKINFLIESPELRKNHSNNALINTAKFNSVLILSQWNQLISMLVKD